tara:strand:+ start:222 stop:962 length:741 start_codon:yes stop_codon:yes gene_type:complete
MVNLKTFIFLFLLLLSLVLLNLSNTTKNTKNTTKNTYETIKIGGSEGRYSDSSDSSNKINIIRIPNFITEKECKRLIKLAKPTMTRSYVVGLKKNIKSNHRTSTNTFLDRNVDLVDKIFNKLETITHIPKKNYEDIQIARYKPKQFYKQHYDICVPFNSPSCKQDIKMGGKRIKTAIIYLNKKFTKGHTSFPLLKKKYKLEPGSVIIFDNIYNKNKYKLALHQGTPVKKGEKWIATVWIRENEFTP